MQLIDTIERGTSSYKYKHWYYYKQKKTFWKKKNKNLHVNKIGSSF